MPANSSTTTDYWTTVKVGDHAIAENGSTIVSGKVTEVGPGYIVLDHLIGSISAAKGWHLQFVLTEEDIETEPEGPET